MWALVRREIEDMWVYYLSVILFSVILILLAVSNTFYGERSDSEGFKICIVFGTTASCLLFAAMGVSQMYLDRTKKISAFLSAHTVGRSHVYIAKIITGFLLILIFYAAVAVSFLIFTSPYNTPYYAASQMLVIRFLSVTCLAGASCYALGLSMGWTSGKIFPTLGTLVLVILLLTLILIKGISSVTYIIFAIFIGSTLFQAWKIYRKTAL